MVAQKLGQPQIRGKEASETLVDHTDRFFDLFSYKFSVYILRCLERFGRSALRKVFACGSRFYYEYGHFCLG
jgi:hypothetical protein